MKYQLNVWKALIHPRTHLYQLAQSEVIGSLKRNTFILLLLSLSVFFVKGMLGIEQHPISRELVTLSMDEFIERKTYFFVGQILNGGLYPLLFIVLPAIYYWSLTDIEFKKLIAVQMIVFPIYLLQSIIQALLYVLPGLPWYSSPLSLGILAQILTNNEFFIYFFGSITWFQVWIFYIQFKALKELTSINNSKKILFITVFHIIIILIHSLLSYIDFYQLVKGL
jgi:hypothetical protein